MFISMINRLFQMIHFLMDQYISNRWTKFFKTIPNKEESRPEERSKTKKLPNFLESLSNLVSWPTRIRTLTDGTKNRSATVTLWVNISLPNHIWLSRRKFKTKFLFGKRVFLIFFTFYGIFVVFLWYFVKKTFRTFTRKLLGLAKKPHSRRPWATAGGCHFVSASGR